MNVSTVESCGYKEKLGKYGVSPRLCANVEMCEQWLNLCEKNDMIWLKDSYATFVHKDFNNYFERKGSRFYDEIPDSLGTIVFSEYNGLLDHTNVLKSKINDVDIITTSPNFIHCEYMKNIDSVKLYIINPKLLEDYTLDKNSLAFTDAEVGEMLEINKTIEKESGIEGAFRLVL